MRMRRFMKSPVFIGLLSFACFPAFAMAGQLKLLSAHAGQRPPALDHDWPAVLTHTHNWRFRVGENAGNFDVAEQKLVAWCRKLGVKAVGVGSAWNPQSLADFDRYEGPERNLYYSGRFDQKSVMETASVKQTLQYLNTLSHGSTLFYLDNETPKNRMGHVWWFGYYYDYPPWHDYSQDRPIKYYEADPSVEINPLNGKPQTRRNLFEIMAVQRRAGAIGIFAHPTRWWIDNGKFVTNIAAMSALFLTVDGYLDGMAVMGDRVYNKSYQDLWLSYLDTGGKVPGFAETDFFLNEVDKHNSLDTFLNHPHIGDRPLTEDTIRDVAKTGEVFFSNGGFVNISVDGVPMGSVLRIAPGKQHKLRIEVYPPPHEKLGRIEIVGRHGAILATKKDFPGGILEYLLPGRSDPGYVLVRAFGAGDDPVRDPDHVKYLAVSNPVYLWPEGFEIKPAHTLCRFQIPADSKWNGGLIEFQTTDGRLIAQEPIRPGTIEETLPANARIVLKKPGVESRMFYIAMENPEVEKDISYLTSGEFRNDFPHLSQSVVPPQAFRLDDLRKAVQRFDYQLK
jgi:hypothetical protein